MRKKGFLRRVFVVASALLLGLLLAGCDYQVARSDLNGRWLAFGGRYVLELANGSFTRTMPVVGTHSGTFETSGNQITLHRRGYSPETFRFDFRFPALILELEHGQETIFYHDSPREPDSLEGQWAGFTSLYSTTTFIPIMFGETTPQRGNRLVREGIFQMGNTYKGEYTVRARNLPNSSVLELDMTHIGGSVLFNRINNWVPVHLFPLFDWERLNVSLPGEGTVWFTLEEATWFFIDAAMRADNIVHERQILTEMYWSLGLMIEDLSYYYVLDEDPGVILDFWGDAIPGNAVVTWVDRVTGAVLTFARDE